MNMSPEYDPRIFDFKELMEILDHIESAERLEERLGNNMNDLMANLVAGDWMQIINTCVNEYDMDVEMTMRYNLPMK